MRESSPMPAITSVASAPTRSQMFAISLAKPIFIARNALAAYLIISALVSVVVPARSPNPCRDAATPGGGAKPAHQRLRKTRASPPACRRRSRPPRCDRDRASHRSPSLRAGTPDCWPRRSESCAALTAASSRCPSRTSASTRFPQPTGTVDLFTTTRKPARPWLRRCSGGGFQVSRVRLAARQRRSADRDEDDVAFRGRGRCSSVENRCRRGPRPEPASLQVRFVNGDSPRLQARDLGGVGIDAGDVMPEVERHAPVTVPTYPVPMTVTRIRKSSNVSFAEYSNYRGFVAGTA